MAMSTPDDIMLLIFEQLVRADGAETVWPDMLYDHRAAQAPFIVSAVCRRWRELALTASALWTYFGFPRATSMEELDLQRLEVLQSRVGNAPIDVVFGWDHRHEAERCNGQSDVPFSVFEAIMGLHAQWRTVVLHVVGSAECGWTLGEAFQCSQWPLLESLSLAIDENQEIMPAAPRLRRMWLDCHHNAIDEPFIAGGYPELTMLSLYCDSVPILRDLAPTFGDQLIELVIIDDVDYFVKASNAQSTRSVFSALQSLTLDDPRWLHHIDTPSLQKLLVTSYIDRVEQEALRRIDHVRELQLCGTFLTTNLALYKSLSNITTLCFGYPSTLSTAFRKRHGKHQVNSKALLELESLEPLIWPHLERLHFGTALYHSPSVGSVDQVAQDILDFVSARNSKAISPNESPVARIIEVVADHDPGALEWFEGRLRELIES